MSSESRRAPVTVDSRFAAVLLTAARAAFNVQHLRFLGAREHGLDERTANECVDQMVYISALVEDIVSDEAARPSDDALPESPDAEQALIDERGRHGRDVEALGTRLSFARTVIKAAELVLEAHYARNHQPEPQRMKVQTAAYEALGAAIDAFEEIDEHLPHAPESW